MQGRRTPAGRCCNSCTGGMRFRSSRRREWRPACLASGAARLASAPRAVPFIGHSESGHHHVLVADGAKLFQDANAPEGMRVLYAILKSPGQLKHLRDFDTHAPHVFEAGNVIMFRCDREFDHMEIERAGFVTDVGATTASEA